MSSLRPASPRAMAMKKALLAKSTLGEDGVYHDLIPDDPAYAPQPAQPPQNEAGNVMGQSAGVGGTVAGSYYGTQALTPAAPAAAPSAAPAASYAGYSSGSAPVQGSGFASTGTEPISAAADASQVGGASVVPEEAGFMANASALGPGPLAGIAAGTYLAGNAAYNQLQGKEDKSPAGYAGRAQLAVSTGGLSELAKAVGIKFGHGKNYYDGKNRQHAIGDLSGGSDTLSLPTKGGGSYSVTGDQFRKDGSYYNVGEGVTPEEVAHANILLGIDAGNTDSVGTLKHQEAALIANMIHAGVDPAAIQAHLGGQGAPVKPSFTPLPAHHNSSKKIGAAMTKLPSRSGPVSSVRPSQSSYSEIPRGPSRPAAAPESKQAALQAALVGRPFNRGRITSINKFT